MEGQRESGQTSERRTLASMPRERQTTIVPRSPAASGSTSVPRSTRRIPAYDPSSDLPTPTAQSSSALTPITRERPADNAPVIVAPNATRPVPALLDPHSAPIIKPWMRLTAGLIAIVACIVAVLGFQFVHPSSLGDRVNGPTGITINGTPQPSGHGPLTASIGVIVAMPAPQAQHSKQSNSSGGGSNGPTGSGNMTVYGLTSIQPCHDAYQFVPNISQWTVPPGCYSYIFRPNPANYPPRASWGWCNWWVEESHPQDPNVTGSTRYPRGTAPVANAAVFIDGGEQGASAEGHWVESIAVSPGGYWVLIAEMNFAWRGAGWGLVDYRYIHVSPHVHFLYGV
ncbi:MAG TPA: hypothetical protein VF808_03800 [Ktedonobacterales bacterium]